MKTYLRTLRHFIRNECANQCDNCQVLGGIPCRYFERAVLGPPDYPYKTPGYDWEKLFEAYAQINPTFRGHQVTVRRCECGQMLGPRERVCLTCRERRRRASYRESKRKLRQNG